MRGDNTGGGARRGENFHNKSEYAPKTEQSKQLVQAKMVPWHVSKGKNKQTK